MGEDRDNLTPSDDSDSNQDGSQSDEEFGEEEYEAIIRGDEEQLQQETEEGETDYLTEQLPTSTPFDIRLQVFVPSTIVILAFVLAGILFTDPMATVFQNVHDWITQNLGWFYILALNVFLIFVIWLAFSRYADIRLGPDDAEPDFSFFSWITMLFSAGIGIGFVFFGVAEPLSHFAIDPPPWLEAESGSIEAARESMIMTFLHWGLHGWAIYVVIGLSLCYFAYRRGLPLTLRSAFYPLIGNRIRGWMGDVVDTLAIFGTLFGVSVSLGLGATQINSGLNFLAGIESSVFIQVVLIAVITAIAVVSVVLGVSRGIRRLSVGNIILFTSLLAFVFIFGPTIFLATSLLENIGLYIRELPVAGTTGAAFNSHEWQGAWTLFYWGWWVSWSPFVGMFIARISRGRTIREFIAGVLLVPVLLSFVVFTVFGYTGINFELSGQEGIVAATEAQFEFAFFAMLEYLPIATISSIVAIVVITIFFVTSSDSGSLVNDIHASGGSINPHRATRIFWAVAEGAVAATLLVAAGEAGLTAFQLSVLATGLPLTLLLIAMCVALVRSLRQDMAIQEVMEHERLLEETRRAVIHDFHQQSWPISAGPWRIRRDGQPVESGTERE
jgi:choline/glycine/proline betaine transport protein